MAVVVVGLEHTSASLELLERVAVPEADRAKVLGLLRDRANLEESVLLSTCLRTEVYAVVDRFHDAVSEVHELLAEKAGMTAAELEPYVTVRFDDDVAAHLFAVAGGLESIVVGESEVLGQVRRAWQQAHDERVSGPVLAGLFRHAVETGKRVRAETAIGRGTASFAHAAVALAARALPEGLSGTTVVVVGAGEVGAGLTRAVVSLPEGNAPRDVVLVNRSEDRAAALVSELGSPAALRTVPLSALPEIAAAADVVLSALDADGPVIGAEQLAPLGSRTERPLLAVDLGVPRNVHRGVADVPGVRLMDIGDVRTSLDETARAREAEIEGVRAIVSEELARYRDTSRARAAAPVISALRARLEGIRVAELERRRPQFGQLTDEAWAEIEEASRAALAKLLHEPTMLLKETASTPRGERLVEALRILFDL
ncbi:MAG TPA: glutamyl-tRNA reductase [Acidimicrobiales bacterium]|nr:glutamyl-tRNA reductase [Acidimicrobiales bacterium]